MNTPESNPPGVEHRLRLTVRDTTVDSLLERMTDYDTRHTLPGYLFVFSTLSYIHSVDDTIDGYSHKDAVFSGYRRRLNDYNRNTFNLGEEVKLEGRRLFLQVALGQEVASRLFSPPFTQEAPDAHLQVRYTIPGSEPIDPLVVDDLRSLAQEHPKGVFDELVLVTGATALRPLFVRSRERIIPPREPTDDILQT